jgi:hypothetical protein
VEIEMGFKLRGAFVEAGLPEPRVELNAPVGGGPRWGGYEFAAGTIRSLLPLVERFGIATPPRRWTSRPWPRGYRMRWWHLAG